MGGAGRTVTPALALALALTLLAHTAPAVPGDAAPASFTVYTGEQVALPPFPRDLLGVAHEPKTADVAAALADAGVPHARVDAYLERVAPAPGVRDWSGFDARLAAVQDAGAEPVLILSYTPAWLSTCPTAGPAAPQHCPPADLDAWAALAREAVTRAATQWDVTWFEVWNEPDHPAFWRGTLADYLALYTATARAVEDVADATDRDLRVGGPATLFPDPVWIPAVLAHARENALPVDFVSYHYYADYPLHGPIGPSPGTGVTDNPALTAEQFATHARLVRAWTDAAGFPDAEVWLDEWNVNAGDAPRQRGPFGAAFVTAVVDALADSNAVDRANYFQTQGDTWGLFADDGTPRPAWHAFDAMLGLGPDALGVTEEGAPHAGALAARGADGAVNVLAFNFNAQADVPVAAHLAITGVAEGTVFTVRDLDGRVLREGAWPADGLDLGLPNLAVVLVSVTTGP